MVTKIAVRGFSVLAMVGFGLFSGVAFAAPGGSPDSDSCPAMSPSIIPQECTAADASAAVTGEDVAALFARLGHPAVSLSAQAPVAGNSAVLTGEEMAALWAKTASAAPVTFADSAACREMSFYVDALSYNKSPCATTGASQIIPMTGTYLPGLSFHTPQTSDYPAGR